MSENKRIVIKIGSQILTRADGTLNVTQMSSFVDQISELRNKGYQVIVVSSGAVASGRSEIPHYGHLDSVEQRQLFSAVGQVKLLGLYYDLFRERGLQIGQVLAMKENFRGRREYLNLRRCMEIMLQNNVVPIVNENDTVSITELMFTDNDELSGLIASMMNAQMLIILSNVDGIWIGQPNEEGSKILDKVYPETNLDTIIQPQKSHLGRGGMTTKCHIARNAAAEGIQVFIANGSRPQILTSLIENPISVPHTEFIPSEGASQSSIKKWIAHSTDFSKGSVYLNHKATQALLKSSLATSVLMIGITRIEGDFEEGDIITIYSDDEKEIGWGKTSFSSSVALTLIGKRGQRPLVHYDYLIFKDNLNF